MSESSLSPEQQDRIKAILEDFDFEQVYLVMHALSWGWGGTMVEGEFHQNTVPPTPVELRAQARELLELVAARVSASEDCGGFTAESDELGYLTLRFVVAEVFETGDTDEPRLQGPIEAEGRTPPAPPSAAVPVGDESLLN